MPGRKRSWPNLSIIPASSWRNRKKSRKLLISITSVPLEVRTEHLPNTHLDLYLYPIIALSNFRIDVILISNSSSIKWAILMRVSSKTLFSYRPNPGACYMPCWPQYSSVIVIKLQTWLKLWRPPPPPYVQCWRQLLPLPRARPDALCCPATPATPVLHGLQQRSGNFFIYYPKIYLFTPKLPPWFGREKIIDYLNSKGLLNLYIRRIQLYIIYIYIIKSIK
jgi:hypothetical protein